MRIFSAVGSTEARSESKGVKSVGRRRRGRPGSLFGVFTNFTVHTRSQSVGRHRTWQWHRASGRAGHSLGLSPLLCRRRGVTGVRAPRVSGRAGGRGRARGPRFLGGGGGTAHARGGGAGLLTAESDRGERAEEGGNRRQTADSRADWQSSEREGSCAVARFSLLNY